MRQQIRIRTTSELRLLREHESVPGEIFPFALEILVLSNLSF